MRRTTDVGVTRYRIVAEMNETARQRGGETKSRSLPRERQLAVSASVFRPCADSPTPSAGSLAFPVAGVVPAVSLTRLSVGRGGSRLATSRHARTSAAVVALQAGMSAILLSGAALLVRSVIDEQRVNPGFQSGHLLTFRVDLGPSMQRNDSDLARGYAEVEAALRSLGRSRMSRPP